VMGGVQVDVHKALNRQLMNRGFLSRPLRAVGKEVPSSKVGYRWGRDGAGQETEVMDYLEFIARVTSHIPDKGQVMVRYFGLCKALHKPD